MWKIYGQPAILYGLDTIQISHADLVALEKIQRELCRILLRLPINCNAAVLYSETGLRPLVYNVIQGTINFWMRNMLLSRDSIVLKAIDTQKQYFMDRGWDWNNPPDPMVDNGYKNCHLWLKRVAECGQALGINIDQIIGKQAVKTKVTQTMGRGLLVYGSIQ